MTTTWPRCGARLSRLARLAGLLALPVICDAAPLPAGSIPEALRPWVPWVLHGNETIACPRPYDAAADGTADAACIWPGAAQVEVAASGATFRIEVTVYGAPQPVELPGDAEHWPLDVMSDGAAVPVTQDRDRPVAWLAPGAHQLRGTLRWAAMPADLQLPRALGALRLSIEGVDVQRAPDEQGRVWLRRAQETAHRDDALAVRTMRLIDDTIPLQLTTRYELAVAGRAREIQLPAALLGGAIPVEIRSDLPARLASDGTLALQARAGNWIVEIRGRIMAPLHALGLPAAPADAVELWSVANHNDLRLIAIEGVPAVDPKQAGVPPAWSAYPAYRVAAGQSMRLVEARRGNPTPAPDALTLARDIWLDFDGRGYTLHDRIDGALSRSWRLEMARPAVLGRAAINGQDQPITRAGGDAESGAEGIEVRFGRAAISADGRIEGAQRQLPATGWLVDFNQASVTLHLPPGWRLLHATGVDAAPGSWLAAWSLWDFFFVLLSALAAARLQGWRSGVVVGVALALAWHMPGAPQLLWLALLAVQAAARVVPAGTPARVVLALRWLCAGLVALLLVPYAVDQVRLSLYPSLEHPFQAVGATALAEIPARAAAPALRGKLVEEESEADLLEKKLAEPAGGGAANAPPRPLEMPAPAPRSPVPSSAAANRVGPRSTDVDPDARTQTGPGLPSWQWDAQPLHWQGPVQKAQTIRLILLSPAGTVAVRIGSLVLLLAALWAIVGRPGGAGLARRRARFATPPLAALAALGLVLGGAATPDPADAATPPPAAARAAPVPAPSGSPPAAAPDGDWLRLLDQLRDKLAAGPDCLPRCADVARLDLEADSARLRMRLQVHAAADVAVPLPGLGAGTRPLAVLVDGQPAIARRDAHGVLSVALARGVRQVMLDFDVGALDTVQIALPMTVRQVTAQAGGWTLGGLDARGLAAGALSLQRAPAARQDEDRGTQRDALPPLVRIERTLHLGVRWTIETLVQRIAPSRAPLAVRVRLVDGEAVNDSALRVADGSAELQLGAEDSYGYTSTVAPGAQLALVSGTAPNQIETWHLDASPQWHVVLGGIPPVLIQRGDHWNPQWQPWPGERATLAITQPAGVAGQTLTVDALDTTLTPGRRATDVAAQFTLRSSRGLNQRVTIPADAQLQRVTINGRVQAIQAEGREVALPVVPGQQAVRIDWREPRGIGWHFATDTLALGLPGVNAGTHLNVPSDQIVLLLGGPRLGPAVLLWGIVATLAIVAIVLARTALTPLGWIAWFLLGLGLAQSSLIGAGVVVAWFLLLAARQRYAVQLGRLAFNAMQVVLALWTVVAGGFLFDCVRVGLLGYPDMMIRGNGSDAQHLNWYQDRYAQLPDPAWVLSMPVLLYRLAMLAWALWLAAALLRWVKWAWQCASADGLWRRRPGAPRSTPPVAPPP